MGRARALGVQHAKGLGRGSGEATARSLGFRCAGFPWKWDFPEAGVKFPGAWRDRGS